MKKTLCAIVLVLTIVPAAMSAQWELFLNAFGETATAYLNDSFLLMGTVADGFVADIIQKNTAHDIVTNVQKRIRIIRAKLKDVSETDIARNDRKLVVLLDNAYACMDHLAWSLAQYIKDKSPETAQRFEKQRSECLLRIQNIADFYSALPPPAEVAEPLSTR